MGVLRRRRTARCWRPPSSPAWNRLPRPSTTWWRSSLTLRVGPPQAARLGESGYVFLLTVEVRIVPMTIEIRVPRLGWNMEEGVFVAWLKRDGDLIKPGDPLFTLEGDKAVQDIEATDAGTLRIDPNGPGDGDTVAVGTLLGYL